ncbi:MAG: hypothetical protein KI793_11625 [Rivularia sp. (in: Bacteria)]|nr:hypothetical protein [Rivularia sp. MS3]
MLYHSQKAQRKRVADGENNPYVVKPERNSVSDTAARYEFHHVWIP